MFFTVRTKLAVDAATAAKSSGRRSFSGAKAKAATGTGNQQKILFSRLTGSFLVQ